MLFDVMQEFEKSSNIQRKLVFSVLATHYYRTYHLVHSVQHAILLFQMASSKFSAVEMACFTVLCGVCTENKFLVFRFYQMLHAFVCVQRASLKAIFRRRKKNWGGGIVLLLLLLLNVFPFPWLSHSWKSFYGKYKFLPK